MNSKPLVSFIMATHNRAEVLLQTLEQLRDCGLARDEYEVLVVDNASTDGTAQIVRRDRPDVHLLSLDCNRGSCAKGLALPRARGTYVVFLDDDSYLLDGCLPNMFAHFQRDPALGAAGFLVHLPNGRQESSALPNVFVGCGVGFRRDILNEIGGVDVSYFMQAEEYDISFRLIRSGYTVRTFADLHVLHLKSSTSRQSKRTIFYDVRNNLTLAATYLPAPWHHELLRDWDQRYRLLAIEQQAEREYRSGRLRGLIRGYARRFTRPRLRLARRHIDILFGVSEIELRMAELRAAGVSRILFADLGKNIYTYYQAARAENMEIPAVLDDRFADLGERYREVKILTRNEGLKLEADAIVISNSSPVHARQCEQEIAELSQTPVFRWHGRWDFEEKIDHSDTTRCPEPTITA